MRTTIEITDEQRARLVEMAARRGMKGFSLLVQEALEQYLRGEHEKGAARRAALTLKGSLSDEDAAAMLSHVQELRSKWR